MVNQGYRKTDIGIIPDEWSVIKVKDIVTAPLSYGVNAAAVEYDSNLPQYIRITDITDDGRYDSSNKVSIDIESLDKYTLSVGDILFARTGASTGKTYLYTETDGKLIYAGFLIRANIDTDKYDPYYVFLQFHTPRYYDWVSVMSTRSGQPGINGKEYGSYQLPMPSLDEQKAIAAALSDIDALIANLEKLIAKKKAIKQGAMQELLTGKRRLPGFDGEWDNYRFGDVFVILPNNAFTRAEMSDSGIVKNIHYGDILTKYHEYISAESDEIPYIASTVDLSRFSDKCFVKSGDIIIADTAEDETVGKALEVIGVSCLMLSGQHTMLCRPQIPFAERFLGYYLNAACYHEQLIPYITGTKVSSVSKANIVQTYLRVPGIQEQTAIADILTDMDIEITKLEENLAKYRLVKQGMMSELLTGRIRLTDKEDA